MGRQEGATLHLYLGTDEVLPLQQRPGLHLHPVEAAAQGEGFMWTWHPSLSSPSPRCLQELVYLSGITGCPADACHSFLVLSPPPTGTTLPATLPTRRSPRKSTPTRRTSERLPASVSITLRALKILVRRLGHLLFPPCLLASSSSSAVTSTCISWGEEEEPQLLLQAAGWFPGPSCTPTAGQTWPPRLHLHGGSHPLPTSSYIFWGADPS